MGFEEGLLLPGITARRYTVRAIGTTSVAHNLLVSICHKPRDRPPYADLGAGHFDALDTARLEQQHVKPLNAPGFSVALTPFPLAEPVPA